MGLEVAADWGTLRSPEPTSGTGRAAVSRPKTTATTTPSDITPSASAPAERLVARRPWTAPQHAVLDEAGGSVSFAFHARDANLVMGPTPPGEAIPFQVLLDGQPPGDAHGTDVDADGRGTVTRQDTYQLIRQGDRIDEPASS